MSNKKAVYEDSFRKQIVELINNGKSINQISKEYNLSTSTVHNWVKKYNNSGSFKDADNRTEEEKKLLLMEKENKQLRMENDILKQAALIMGRK